MKRRVQAARLPQAPRRVVEIDFFGAIGREAAERSLKELEARLTEDKPVGETRKSTQKQTRLQRCATEPGSRGKACISTALRARG